MQEVAGKTRKEPRARERQVLDDEPERRARTDLVARPLETLRAAGSKVGDSGAPM